jgi:hypothetical protein
MKEEENFKEIKFETTNIPEEVVVREITLRRVEESPGEVEIEQEKENSKKEIKPAASILMVDVKHRRHGPTAHQRSWRNGRFWSINSSEIFEELKSYSKHRRKYR